jgi:beta-glucosidase
MVLLKNADGILPIKSSYKTIAVVGPNAESLIALEGNYNGVPSQLVYPVEGMRKAFGGKARILFAQGSPHVSQLPVPVPSTVFHTGSEEGSPGLKAEHFPNTDFSGKAVVTRVNPQIQFDWYAAAPAKGIPMKNFAVRWSGTLRAPGPGSHTFSVPEPEWNPHGGKEILRIHLDARIVLDTNLLSPATWIEEGGEEPVTTFQAYFEDTKAHAFRFEYVHESPLFGAGATHSWQPPQEVLRDGAVKAARQADVVAAFVGLSPGLEGEEMPVHVPGFSGRDRTEGLPDAQQELREARALQASLWL